MRAHRLAEEVVDRLVRNTTQESIYNTVRDVLIKEFTGVSGWVARIPITPAETLKLVEASTRDRVFSAGFGPSGTWLLDEPSNRWAIEMLADLRGT